MTNGMHKVKLSLSKDQIRKAARGQQIQVKAGDIGVGHECLVHPETYKKLVSAHKRKCGARIHMTSSELEGSGFMDFLKTIASPVLSGLQGVAKEIFPSHKGTIDSIREGIRGATGYGIKGKGKFAPGGIPAGPTYFPAQRAKRGGNGINPSGFY